MNFWDIATAFFEIGAAVVVAQNVIVIRRDKQVRGVSIWPTAFFTAWGVYNVFFFRHAHMPLAQWAAGVVAVVNSVWIFYALKYRKN